MHLLANGFSILAKMTTCFPPRFGLSAFLKQQAEAGLAKATHPLHLTGQMKAFLLGSQND